MTLGKNYCPLCGDFHEQGTAACHSGRTTLTIGEIVMATEWWLLTTGLGESWIGCGATSGPALGGAAAVFS